MRKLTLTKKVYQQYKNEVRGNEGTSLHQAQLKFTRNMRLGLLSVRPKGKGTYCRYGDLHFIISDSDVVVWMRNQCPAPVGWKRDNKKYLELNKELGIEDDITMLGLIARDVKIRARINYGRIKWNLKKRCAIVETQ